MTLDLLDRIEAVQGSLDALSADLASVDEDEALALRLALVHCVRALRHAQHADGLTRDKRQAARSAYRMGCAALGIDHV